MPKGRCRPVANVDICTGLPFLTPWRMRISPLLLSARNTSPLGAERSSLGSSRLLANKLTRKPDGAFGIASCGRGKGSAKLLADFLLFGGGKSLTVIL